MPCSKLKQYKSNFGIVGEEHQQWRKEDFDILNALNLSHLNNFYVLSFGKVYENNIIGQKTDWLVSNILVMDINDFKNTISRCQPTYFPKWLNTPQ